MTPFHCKAIKITRMKKDAAPNTSRADPLDKLPEILKKNLDRNLCVCNDVLKVDIINAIDKGATTVEAIRQQTYATEGNGCCTKQIERLIECLISSDAKNEQEEKA